MDFTRCYGCMRELPAPGAVCPRCGYDNTNDPGKQPSHVLPCGTVLNGKFIIGRVLGQGGFGITYIAWNLVLEKRVCIKEYFPSGAAMRSATQSQLVLWSGDENSRSLKANRESFIKEARKAVKLSNLSSVVEVLDVFYENETAYIVMDYIEGETLKSRMVRTQMTLGEEECVTLLAPMMEDMGRAHQQGIIHRDIKPDNIMLRTDGSPVLLDMGAAKDLSKTGTNNRRDLSQGQSPDGDNPENVLPTTNAVSHGFSPMEQYSAKSENIGSWTDVYAMSATILYCVSGKVPPAANERAIGAEIRYDGVSPAFAEVLDKGLAFQAQDRIQTMGELLEALRAAVKMEKDYQTAKELMGQKDAESLKKAAAIFKEISQYRDSKALHAECMKRLREKKPLHGLLAAVAAVLILIPVCAFGLKTKPVTITDSGGNTYIGTVKDNLYNGQGTMIYANGAKYEGEWKDGNRNGQGTQTYANGDVYTGEWKDDKLNGQGTCTYANGAVYTGEWKDDKLNGQGTNTYANGNVYTGEYKNDKPNGQGTITYAEDDAYGRLSYEGEWVDGNKSGQGTMKWKNGAKYEGEWKDGNRNGQGTQTYANGDVYTGEWKDDKLNGQGTCTYANGAVYTGEYKDDKPNGQGTITYAEDDAYGRLSYEGEWVNGNKSGQGTMKWKNGEKYEGEWKNDTRNGQGTDTFANGAVYTGEWKDGKRNGQGTHTFANGDVYTGEYKDDKPNGQGTITYAEDDAYGRLSYEGEWVDGNKSGQGTMKWKNGEKYEGEWKNDTRNGQGTQTFANGAVYTGEWKDGRNGQGTHTFANGDVYTGEWKDDKRNGQGTYTYANGNVYTGEYKNDKPNGQGTITYAEDDAYGRLSYEGEWVDGNKSGQGTMKWKNGNVYTGEWKDGQMNGQGTFTWGENTKWPGDVYVGEFVDDKRTGLGAMLYSDGCYIGEWSGGKKNGLGIRRSQNEENVIGVWQADSPQPLSALPSEFEIIDTSEYYYIGEVKDGKRNGKGICIWRENENIYAGEWKADKQIGSGVYIWTNRDDNVYVGEFDEHWLNGQGCLRWNNGDFYIGEFQNGQITGWGTKINADGLTATGQWKDSAFLG